MKKCPKCERTYDELFSFCLEDGSLLSASYDPDATLPRIRLNGSDSLVTEVIKFTPTDDPKIAAQISKVINGFDHDLTSDEEDMVRRILSDRTILKAYKDFEKDERYINEDLKEEAKKKIEDVARVDEHFGLVLTLIPLSLGSDRRQNAFHRTVVNNSVQSLINVLREIETNNPIEDGEPWVTKERWGYILGAFECEADSTEFLVDKVFSLLYRKRAKITSTMWRINFELQDDPTRPTGELSEFTLFMIFLSKNHPGEHRRFTSQISSIYYKDEKQALSLVRDAITIGSHEKARRFLVSRGLI